MSTEETKKIARRMTEEVINQKNLALVDELIDTNSITHTTIGDFKGPEGLKQFFIIYLTAFPDMHIAIDDELAEGDKVMQRATVRGTHRGNLMDIPPTGKQITMMLINIVRTANGKSVEAWALADLLGMMQQLGVVPSKG